MASKEQSYWLKSGFYTISERLSVLFFGFGSLILLLRTFTKEEYGTWVLFLTVTSLLEVSRVGLQQNALVKFLTTSKDEEYGKIITASFLLNFIITIFCIISLLIGSQFFGWLWSSEELCTMLMIYVVTTTCLVPFYQCNFIQQANLDFRGIFFSTFFSKGLFFAYVLYYYLTNQHLSLVNLALFQILTAITGGVISYLFARKYLQFSKSIDWGWVTKLFNFGKYVFGTNLNAMLYKSIDKMMIGSLVGTAPVAVYELAVRITNLSEVPTFSVAAIVFPQSARQMAAEGKGSVGVLYEKSVGAILALVIPFILFIFVFPEFFIRVLGGDKYLDTVPILQLTIFYGLFIPFATQFGTILDSIGKPKINFYFTIFGTILNVVFNYIFITEYGLIGAAYGTLTTYLITFALHQYVLYKMLGIKAYNAFYYILDFYKQAYTIAYDFFKAKLINVKAKYLIK